VIQPVNRNPEPVDHKQLILDAFEEYRQACYGDQVTSGTQFQEVRQAFLSGILWSLSHPQQRMAMLKAVVELARPKT